jgi:hypothetical protein
MFKLFALVTTIILTAATPKEPELKFHYSDGYNYEAVNPLLDAVELTIDCGHDMELARVTMSPRTKEQLLIKTDDGKDAVCTLGGWKRLK